MPKRRFDEALWSVENIRKTRSRRDCFVSGIRPKKFSVRATRHQRSNRPSAISLFGIVVSIASSSFGLKYAESQTSLALIVVGGLIAFCISTFILADKISEEIEVSLTVNSMSVQLATHCNGKLVRHPLLIPQRLVIDVVVNEVILSHKVVSIVVLRLLNESASTLNEKRRPIQALLEDQKVRLEVAFPGVELSYGECMSMRRDINNAFGIAKS